MAAPAEFQSKRIPDIPPAPEALSVGHAPSALLRYWRAALRSDPRGAIAETSDRHGSSWHLVSGPGPIAPSEESLRKLSIRLDDLRPDFRKALLARNANEQTLALGWPIAIGRKSGAPVIWPVGLLAADWRPTEDRLEIVIHANDVLVNPEWIKGAARSFGWTERGLRDVFSTPEGVGLTGEDFLGRLREAASGAIKGRVTGMPLASQLDPDAVGIVDIAGLFLPIDSTFTAGAVRDLDAIAAWPAERLARTALAPALGLAHTQDIGVTPAINTDPLNAEQIAAVRNACHAPLSVVTGPPGTGKSQAIVSIAASVLNAGGSVLVASKNHQALDAVEERLSSLAPDAAFLVRTLDPAREIDRSLPGVFAELIAAVRKATRTPDDVLLARLATLARQRELALDLGRERDSLQCDIAELLDRIAVRERAAAQNPPSEDRRPEPTRSWLRRLLDRLRRVLFQPPARAEQAAPSAGATTEMLQIQLEAARARLADLPVPQDAVALTQEIADLVREALPLVLSRRASLSADDRQALIEDHDNLMLKGGNALVPSHVARAVITHRPLWLASVLGTPKRIPLEDGLFDLAIFDEASQCDIASAMPLLARARRAVVVGDDRQLSFIQQLGVAHDRNLMQAQGLDPAKMGRFAQSRLSLFDFAARIPGVPRILLRDQYRSASEIVDYISGQFYGGQLRTASDPRAMKPPHGAIPGIAWTHVAAPTVPAVGNINAAEIVAIAAHVRTLLVDQRYAGSIGVIAPFRPQVVALTEAIRSSLPGDLLDRAEMRIGTVDSFQGQERDLILFSPCIGPASALSAVGFLQKDWRRLNVAISRARAVAHVFGDLVYARSGRISALARLASYATEPRPRRADGDFDSDWERQVYHALKARGLDPKPQHEIAGRRLDFALFGKDGINLDLEIDGRQWHTDSDGRRKLSDHWRDHQLKSLGWRVRRFWVDELAKNLEACLDAVEHDLS